MKKIFTGLLMVMTMAILTMVTGCAKTLQNRNLDVNTKVSSSIDLNPDILSQGKPIYLLVRDQTSSKSGGDSLETLVSSKLLAKGYKVTKNAKAAAYRLHATFIYLDKAKEGMTEEGAIAGGFGGAILGKDAARYTHGNGTSSLSTRGATSFLTTGLGSLAGSMTSVDSWYGIVDITVEEPLPHAVKKKTKINSGNRANKASGESRVTRTKNGDTHAIDYNASAEASNNSESSSMDYEELATHKKMKTRVVGVAKQTNIDQIEAEKELKAQLSNAIANFF
jgi:hypothetical protein